MSLKVGNFCNILVRLHISFIIFTEHLQKKIGDLIVSGKKSRSHFVVVDFQNRLDRHFNSLSDAAKSLDSNTNILRKLAAEIPVTRAIAMRHARRILNVDGKPGANPAEIIRDVRKSHG